MPEPAAEPRAAYRHFLAIPTRWMDDDSYGHVRVERGTQRPVDVPVAIRAALSPPVVAPPA